MGDQDHETGLSRRAMLTGGVALAAPLGAHAKAYTDPETAAMRLTTPETAQVNTTAGRVRGFERGGVYVFRGIPYGADTAASARFLAPRPAPSWQGVRSALNYGPVCPQPVRDRSNDTVAFICDWDDGYPGEDCLRVNVWSATLDPQARRPVMFWIHGGGFTAGSSQELPAYDGEQLARHGVVVVSVNHRLGPLGYLDLSTLDPRYADSGNVGMLDLVLALQWVRDNAASFGGDPERVTIFGHSGGGAKVSVLMAMPSARGLFHRAIVMSGSFAAGVTRTGAEQTLHELCAELRIAPSIAALQGVEATTLMAASQRLQRRAAPAALRAGPRLGWGAVVDARLFAADWQDRAPRQSADIPLMVGTVRDEIPGFRLPLEESQLLAALRPHFGERSERLVSEVRRAFPGLSAHATAATINGLTWRARALDQLRKQHALGGAAVYSYWYIWPSPLLDGLVGVPHGSDLPAAFDNVARCETLTGNSPQAQQIAAVMHRQFVAFASSGNPSVAGHRWPAFDPREGSTMVFDRSIGSRSHPLGGALGLLAGA